MAGEKDLHRLLTGLRPALREGRFAFVTLPPGTEVPGALEPLCVFREAEGLTLIVELSAAEAHGLAFVYPCRQITLEVHSSLEAVGLIATVATVLVAHGISVNPVSGFFHDHLFVPVADAARALTVLEKLGG